MRSEVMESLGTPHEDLPLRTVDEVIEGEPASFIVYHGSNEPFIKAVPSKEAPVVFYADRPDVAASYPWAKHLHELLGEIDKNDSPDLRVASKILFTEDLESEPFPQKILPHSYDRIYPDRMNDPGVVAAKERLNSDPHFRLEAERELENKRAYHQARGASKDEVVEFETGPLGSVREYLIESRNPAVVDFKGRTWGDMPDPDNEGKWIKPSNRATTEDLRPQWDAWLRSFFDKGHDTVVIRNIRDVGDNFNGLLSTHTTIAVDTKARVEMKKG